MSISRLVSSCVGSWGIGVLDFRTILRARSGLGVGLRLRLPFPLFGDLDSGGVILYITSFATASLWGISQMEIMGF